MSGASAMIGIVWLATTYGHERPLREPGVDERGRERQAKQRAEQEPEQRLAPGVERGTHEVLEQGFVRAALERLPERVQDVPHVGQVEVARKRPAERRVPEDRVARALSGQPPRGTTEELDALPEQEHAHDQDQEGDRPAPPEPRDARLGGMHLQLELTLEQVELLAAGAGGHAWFLGRDATGVA